MGLEEIFACCLDYDGDVNQLAKINSCQAEHLDVNSVDIAIAGAFGARIISLKFNGDDKYEVIE